MREKYLPVFYELLLPKKTGLYEQVERKVEMFDVPLALQDPLVQPYNCLASSSAMVRGGDSWPRKRTAGMKAD